jgi:hypothetical protein
MIANGGYMSRRPVVVMVFLAMTLFLRESGASTTGEYDDIVNKFFDLISQGKTTEAVDSLYKTNPWSDKVQDAIQQVKSSLISMEAISGKYRDSVQIVKKTMGDRLIYMYYLVAYDRQPLRFEFHLYRPGDKWVIQNFAFSDKITEDIRDFAKYDLGAKLK